MCDEVDAHVDALYRRLFDYAEEERAELREIWEKRARLDPEGQQVFDEVVAFLHTATPEMKEDFGRRVKGLKRNLRAKKSALKKEQEG